MGTIMPFDFSGCEVRSGMTDDGQPCIVTKDACAALGISKYRDAMSQLDDDERVSIVVDTPGGRQRMAAVTESGIYGLLLIAPSDKAHAFRRWLKHEVLPQIRRTGEYKKPAPAQLLIGPGRDTDEVWTWMRDGRDVRFLHALPSTDIDRAA